MEVQIPFSFSWIIHHRVFQLPLLREEGAPLLLRIGPFSLSALFVSLPHFHLPDLHFLFVIPFNFHFFPSFSTKMVAQKFLVDLNKPLVFQVNPVTCFSICIFRNRHVSLRFLSLTGWASWRRLRWVGSRAYRKQGRPSLFRERFSGGTHIPIRYPFSFFFLSDCHVGSNVRLANVVVVLHWDSCSRALRGGWFRPFGCLLRVGSFLIL